MGQRSAAAFSFASAMALTASLAQAAAPAETPLTATASRDPNVIAARTVGVSSRASTAAVAAPRDTSAAVGAADTFGALWCAVSGRCLCVSKGLFHCRLTRFSTRLLVLFPLPSVGPSGHLRRLPRL